jgi:hypothetical protein
VLYCCIYDSRCFGVFEEQCDLNLLLLTQVFLILLTSNTSLKKLPSTKIRIASADMQSELRDLNDEVRISAVAIPERLSNAQGIVTALHLAVCGPEINWYLVNKALDSLVYLTADTENPPDKISRSLLVKSVWVVQSGRV